MDGYPLWKFPPKKGDYRSRHKQCPNHLILRNDWYRPCKTAIEHLGPAERIRIRQFSGFTQIARLDFIENHVSSRICLQQQSIQWAFFHVFIHLKAAAHKLCKHLQKDTSCKAPVRISCLITMLLPDARNFLQLVGGLFVWAGSVCLSLRISSMRFLH